MGSFSNSVKNAFDSAVTSKNTVKFSPTLFGSLKHIYTAIVGTFADLDEDIISVNNKLLAHGLRDDERKISLESVMFAAGNAPYLTAMLVLDYKNFRDIAADAVLLEIDIDSLSDKERAAARAEMQGSISISSTHHIEMGITIYSDEVVRNIYDVMDKSFKSDSNESLSAAVDKAASACTAADRHNMGSIVSNYIYLLRALNYNHIFFSKVAALVNSLKKDYRIK